MIPRRARWVALLSVCLLAGGAAPVVHPLHTTLSELSHDARTGEVRVTMRVFVDDLAAAVAGPGEPGRPATDQYLTRRFSLTGPRGVRIPLRVDGLERREDLVWVRLSGTAPAGVRGGSVRNDVAMELFEDQVNVVRARYDGRDRTLLFTRGSGPKRLP